MKKMSRSIKDYKDAMDSIRISDSFYKRTETLLNELPEVKIEKRPFYMSRKITAGIMAAAACIVCVIGIRTVIGIRNDNIASISETGLTEIEKETTEVSVPELIDLLEDEDSIDEMLAEEDEFDDSVEEDAESSAEPLTIDSGGGAAVAAVPDKAESSSGSLEEKGGAGNSNPADGRTGGTGSSTITTGGTGSSTITGGTGSSGAKDTSEDIIMLEDVSFEHVTVEITPYFDMDNIVSGESAVKVSGTDCQELIEYIREQSSVSYKLPNSSFKSLFSLNISDENIGVTFYSIYFTNQNTMIITKHTPDGQQRVTYGLSIGSSRELKHMLFLMFGEESDYELFENLISGK